MKRRSEVLWAVPQQVDREKCTTTTLERDHASKVLYDSKPVQTREEKGLDSSGGLVVSSVGIL